MFSKIKAIEYHLPAGRLTNRQLEGRFTSWDSKKIENKLGIKTRPIAAEHETALDLGLIAAEKVLKNYDRKKIDFVILCTQSPEYYLPSGACILQSKLKLRTTAGAFDINLGCSGYIYGLACAKSFIAAGLAQSILFITAETYSKHIHPQDKSNVMIFGDGAAATIIERSKNEKILKFLLGTDGSGAQNLIVPNGGLRRRFDPRAGEIKDRGSVRTNNNLYMNGPGVFNFTVEKIPPMVRDLLKLNRFALDDIDLVVFHQANKYILESLRERIKIPQEKFYINLWEKGNTVSATIPIALKDAMNDGVLSKGMKVLLVGFGVGYSWGGTVVIV